MKMFSWTLAVVIFAHMVAAEECDVGWFGSDCQYRCHCTMNDCDIDGQCKPSASCEKGWFGLTCQYVDLVTTESTASTPQWLSDGDVETCNDGTTDSATVTLNKPFPFTWLRMRTKDSISLPRIQVELRNGDNILTCEQKSVVVAPGVKDVRCDPQAAVDQVILTGEGVKNLCSVAISGGRNVALKQATWQSSTYAPKAIASHGVDGDTNQNYYAGSCTHTKIGDPNPRWSVIFSRDQMVNRYLLYNRFATVQFRHRLEGFELDSFAEDGATVLHYTDPRSGIKPIYTVTTTSVAEMGPIRRVNITGHAPQGILNFCELEVFGDCAAPTYGLDCDKACSSNCADQMCHINGDCYSCNPGRMGAKCDTECPATKYGPGCSLDCSLNCPEGYCDGVTGKCFDCPAGENGAFCEEDKTCIEVYPTCPENKSCDEAPIPTPTCLPKECQGCDVKEVCDQTGDRVHCARGNLNLNLHLPDLQCGGCPQGKTCKESHLPCRFRWGCKSKSSYSCVDDEDPEHDPRGCKGLLGLVGCLLRGVLNALG